ncbi:MAG: cell migration-inducing and hyaluronan-binding protein, partial [Parvicellaceae bacterium]
MKNKIISFLAIILILSLIGCKGEEESKVKAKGNIDSIKIIAGKVEKKLSELNIALNNDLTIPENLIVTIDRNIDVTHLIIKGSLRCAENTKAYSIIAKRISVMGEFLCGSEEKRYNGKLHLNLRSGLNIGLPGDRAFVVYDGGMVQFFGSEANIGWQRISQTINKNQNTVRLESKVNWSIGDEIVVSSTSFDMNEAERKIITNISSDKKTITVNGQFQFSHYGEIQEFDAGRKVHSLDQRATIANLSRNILIRPIGGDYLNSKIGAHMMSMKGSEVYVDSVEFKHMGQLGNLAKYPFHWHKVGNARGQFIKNSSIHDTFQRCITIHGTNYATVENNVCYNHIGHGYFLEHGSERKNKIIKNLGLVSKKACTPTPIEVNSDQKISTYLNSGKCKALLVSDFHGVSARFPAPSTFWISNPDNDVSGNVASGSDGSGFWMAFDNKKLCNDSKCSVPINQPTLNFSSNLAHSSKVGITWDGAPSGAHTGNPRHPNDKLLLTTHYSPRDLQTQKQIKTIFTDLVAFKNREAGLYFRGDTAQFNDNIYADNRWSVFVANGQIFQDTGIIGISSNFPNRDKDLYSRITDQVGRGGVVIYDGPFELQDVDFINFPSNKLTYQTREYQPYPIIKIGGANRFVNKVKGLRFNPEPYKRMDLQDSDNWVDSRYSYAIRDLDGSLTNRVGSIIVHKDEFNDDPTCDINDEWNALICDYKLALYSFQANGVGSGEIYFIPENPSGV